MDAKIHTIKIGSTNYITSEELFNKAPIYIKGCRNARELIKKKNVSVDNYIFAAKNKKNDEWIITDGSSKKTDQVLLAYDWIQDNVPEINANGGNKKDEYLMLPSKLHLRDEEMFQDNEGNRIHIQVVGEREHDKCYFRVKDIMEGFDMKNLHKTIVDDRRDGYKENIHYKFFTIKKVGSASKKQIFAKELYLTYNGILRVLFASQSDKVDKFVGWATKTLFTVQMGAAEQKNKLAKSLMGVPYSEIKTTFETHTNEVSCVYLVALNSVKNLKEHMNIDQKYDDDMYVCKYGFSKDFKKRMETHKQEYKHIKSANLSLKNIALIDPKYISSAEKEIKEFTAKYSFQFEKFDELVILDKKDFVELEKYYSLLSLKYRGYSEDLNNMIIGLKLSIRDIEHNHKIELLQKDKELLQKDRELDQERAKVREKEAKVREEKLRYESLEKDVKILEMEKRLYQMQNNISPAEKTTKKSTAKK